VQRKIDFQQKPKAQVAQQTLNLLNRDQVHKLNKAAGYAVYCAALPFDIFEGHYLSRFLKQLNPAYTVPSRKLLSTTILNECYDETRNDVLGIIKRSNIVNLITDESSTSAKDRVINFCIHTTRGPLHIKRALVPLGASSAEKQAAGICIALDEIEAEIGQKLPGINSTATDTCGTMRKLWKALRGDRRFKHTLFVPCDSHGIQLLIKDIVMLPEFQQVMRNTNDVVLHFRTSHKQLALLRSYQDELYNKTYAFVLAAETRWGTQFYSLRSLERSKEALKAFARDVNNECKNMTVLKAILDPLFWAKVDELIDILRPLNELQVASESSKSHLGQVEARWRQMRLELSKHRQCPQLAQVLDNRARIQLSDIHLTAFHLDPRNVRVPYNSGDQERIIGFLQLHVPAEKFEAVRRSYLDFKCLYDNFLSSELWTETVMNDPIEYWRLASAYAPDLAVFALRVFNTPPNSAPSERAFSTMKLNAGKFRATMTLERLDKLCFIHVNRCTLDRDEIKGKRHYHQLTEAEELELEEELESIDQIELENALIRDTTMQREDDEDEERPEKRARIDPNSVPISPSFFQAPAGPAPANKLVRE
jgi:hypothetical protein